MPRSPHPLTAAALLAALCSLGCRSAPPPERIEGPPAELAALALTPSELLRLGPNDVLRARVHGHPDLSTPESNLLTGTRVDPDGQLALPLVGAVPVGGLTLEEARGAIRTAYAAYMHEPQVEVSVVEYAARRFYLYGEVKAPGAVPFDRPLNAYQALTYGGGYAPYADRRRIVLLRPAQTGLEVHVIDGERPDSSGLIPILPEDFLFVSRTGVGKFAEEVLPILSGLSSFANFMTTLILLEDRLDD